MTGSDAEAGGREQAPGRRYSYWLGQLLSREREGTGDEHGIGIRKGEPIDRGLLAGMIGYSEKTLERREEGERQKNNPDVRKFTFGDDIDKIVAGYAYILGIDDPRVLWERALKLWHAEGAVPDYKPELRNASQIRPLTPQEAGFERAIADEARRRKRSPAAPKGKPSASQQRKRGAR